ncbi:MAG: cytochrome ubiquinol oxidase subunit I, partial [Myxococcota bacterium]|nr:cytochrome ubiquinol oxidase subunit I [Myxococcota bacterium]
NYPVWNLPSLGGSLVVAIIAVVHVFISHLAVGGGALLAVAEWWSDRQKDGEKIRQFLRKFATFFLVYTTVFGAITGVGIWFSIQLASPEATSLLIHQFVFAWAIEWVAFLAELSVLYLYYYGWKTNSRQMQVFLAVAYFVISWMSLVIINGILTFMLTPGGWTLENTDIFAAFFNPGYGPALVIRTLAMFVLAGLAAMLIASLLEDDDLKARIIRFSAKWIVPAALLMPLFGLWYWSILPESTLKLVAAGKVGVAGGKLEAITRYFWLAVSSGALIVLGTLIVSLRPRAAHFAPLLALFLTAQLGIMGAEFFREMARKPYVIYGVLYSNALWKKNADTPGYLARPYFEATRWEKQGVAPLTLEHGEWVYRLQCATCHTLDGYRGLKTRTAKWQPTFGPRFLEKLEEQGVMPRFHGDENDRAALAGFLMSQSRKKPISGHELRNELRKEEEAKALKEAQQLEAAAAAAAAVPVAPAPPLSPAQGGTKAPQPVSTDKEVAP